jgi:hypothetical protein
MDKVELIQDPQWSERDDITICDEYKKNDGLRIPVPSIENQEECLKLMPPETTQPSGAAAFWYGIDAAKELLGIQRDT